MKVCILSSHLLSCHAAVILSSLFLNCHAAVILQARNPDDIGGAIAFNNQDAAGRYDFGYSEAHPSGATFRKESGDVFGNKYGSYGLRDADGRLRIVNYVADENGFRADVRTNEPGVAPHDPASATFQKPAALLLAPPPPVLPSPARVPPVVFRYVGPTQVRELPPKGYPLPPIYADPLVGPVPVSPQKGYPYAPAPVISQKGYPYAPPVIRGKSYVAAFDGGIPVGIAPRQYPYYGAKSLSGYPGPVFPL